MSEQSPLELTEVVPTPEAPPIQDGPSSFDRWDTKIRSFRVRLIRFDRPESRTLMIRANNEAGARAQAQSRAGQGWRIARIIAV